MVRIRLEYDDRPVFSTLTRPDLGARGVPTTYRTMMVRVGGRTFNVWRTVDQYEMYIDSVREDYINEIDRALVAAMEQMLTQVFVNACAAVPDGAQLL